jgi:hypothetical protein
VGNNVTVGVTTAVILYGTVRHQGLVPKAPDRRHRIGVLNLGVSNLGACKAKHTLKPRLTRLITLITLIKLQCTLVKLITLNLRVPLLPEGPERPINTGYASL